MNKRTRLTLLTAIMAALILSGCAERSNTSETSSTLPVNTIEEPIASASSTESTTEPDATSEPADKPDTKPTVEGYDPQKGIANLTGTMLALDTELDSAVYSGFSAYSAMSTAVDWADGAGRAQVETALGTIDNAKFDASKADYPIETGTMFLIDDNAQLNTDQTDGFVYADLQALEIIDTVNNFAAEKTHNVITEVIGEPFSYESLAAVVDTIYFKGDWLYQFAAEDTTEDTFHGVGGDKKTDFMHQTRKFGTNDELNLFEMKYKDCNIVMDIIYDMSDPNAAFKAYNDAITAGLTLDYERDVVLAMPKFTVETEGKITDAYKNLGITDIFSEGTDYFNKLISHIHLDSVIQKAKIIVDEKGTEAAAVTVIDMKTDSIAPMPVEYKEIKVDKPFFYALRDTETNVILFAGYIKTLE